MWKKEIWSCGFQSLGFQFFLFLRPWRWGCGMYAAEFRRDLTEGVMHQDRHDSTQAQAHQSREAMYRFVWD